MLFGCAICFAVASLVLVGTFSLLVLLRNRGDTRSGMVTTRKRVSSWSRFGHDCSRLLPDGWPRWAPRRSRARFWECRSCPFSSSAEACGPAFCCWGEKFTMTPQRTSGSQLPAVAIAGGGYDWPAAWISPAYEAGTSTRRRAHCLRGRGHGLRGTRRAAAAAVLMPREPAARWGAPLSRPLTLRDGRVLATRATFWGTESTCSTP